MKGEQLSSERENCLHITVATPAYQQSELWQIAHLCISPIIPPKWGEHLLRLLYRVKKSMQAKHLEYT